MQASWANWTAARCGLLLALLSVSPALGGGAEPEDRQTAERELRTRYGLVKLEDQDVWLLREEVRLRADLDSLDEQQGDVQRGQDFVNKLAAAAAEWRPIYERKLQNIAQELRQLKGQPGVVELRKLREAYRKDLEVDLGRCEKPGDVPLVRKYVQQLLAVRNRLTLTLFRIERVAGELSDAYETLQQDSAVQRQLRTLGDDHRLGPLEDYPGRYERRIEAANELVCTSVIPAYLLGDIIRTSAILNESVPIDCSWLPANSREYYVMTVAEHNEHPAAKPPQSKSKPKPQRFGRPLKFPVILRYMADAAGIAIPADAPALVLESSDGRRVTGLRKARATIRLGSCLVEDAEVLVLPLQAAHVGAWLPAAGLPGYTAEEDVQNLQLRIYRSGP